MQPREQEMQRPKQQRCRVRDKNRRGRRRKEDKGRRKHKREGSVTLHKAAGAGGVQGNRVTLERH